jgi:hypothetical protein
MFVAYNLDIVSEKLDAEEDFCRRKTALFSTL